MFRSAKTGERTVAVFCLGLILLNPPVLSIFSIESFVGGLPMLYLYYFLAWGILLVLTGFISRLDSRGDPVSEPYDGPP